MSKRDGKSYFTVFALKDGTVASVLESRKPSKRALGRGKRIDDDGVYREYVTDATTYDNHTDAQRIQKHITIATAINVKRALRQLVVPRLDRLAEQVSALQAQLDRIEQKLGEGR
jgi:hypothetical protein